LNRHQARARTLIPKDFAFPPALEGGKVRLQALNEFLFNVFPSLGPAFLPSEHDDLPPGVAFMTLDSHTTPITALDISEPYGTLVSASQDDAQPRVWDLLSGDEVGRLRGHVGAVHCLQVEDHVCLTGGADGNVRLWDLRRVDEEEGWGKLSLNDIAEEDEEEGGFVKAQGSSTKDGACARVLDGHTKAVTALYFEDDCLVSGL